MDEYTSKPVVKSKVREVLKKYLGDKCTQATVDVSKVLIADDDPEHRDVVRAVIRKLYPSAKIRITGNGVEAITLLGSFKPELLVCELLMSNFPGASVIKFLRTSDRFTRTRILVTTSLEPDDSIVLEVGNLGIHGIVFKPFDAQCLEDLLTGAVTQPIDVHAAALAEPTVPILDPGVLKDMVGDDPDILAEVVDTYLDTLPPLMDDLERAVSSGDMTVARETAHSLKGGAANLGGALMRRIASDVEQAAKAGDASACSEKLPALRKQMEMLFRSLKEQDWS
jgi:CheY-like chemotaxis protein